MKYTVPKGGLVVVGPSYVTACAEGAAAGRVFQQGQRIPAGWTVTDCDATGPNRRAMGIKDEPKAVK